MNLHNYPQQIAEAAEKVNALESAIARARNAIARLEGLADAGSAFDSSLKNDAQRKARRFEILQVMDDFEPLQNQLIELNESKANAMAELEKLRNLFASAKLEARAQIARQLAALEAADFVGL